METTTAYDVIVVLGAAVRRDGSPSAAMLRRTRHAAKLFHAACAPRLLLTGGCHGKSRPSEAAVMAEVAIAAGVPARCLVREPRARTTMENAAFSAALMRRHGWRRGLIVTDAYHLPRARLAFRAHGVDADARAVPGTAGHPLSWLREAAAITWYALRLMFSRQVA